jgi:hypothetical protein
MLNCVYVGESGGLPIKKHFPFILELRDSAFFKVSFCCAEEMDTLQHLVTGLPDGLFSYQKSQFG